MHGHEQIYHLARCYDVAFGFRNVDAECDTLTALVARHAQRPLASVLELAAGPARPATRASLRGAVFRPRRWMRHRRCATTPGTARIAEA